ncbi:MAG TPA: efflux RND transporter permease subunit [Planctomycetota bacterium]|jgi:hydrophobe/amphiphile efflux-1 (HAE1) family protein
MSGGISAPFIRRPIGTSLLMLAIMLVGIIAYRFLPVSALPRIDFATINVSASLPGADPETMASSVAAPLERRFGQIAGVSELTSVSGVGSSSITIQFSLDRSVDLAARDVQAAITAARSELPTNLPNPPTWRKSNPADAPILIIALTSKTLAPGKVYQAASTILAQRIAQVPGVAQVIISGAQKSAVRVQVNPTALASMGIGLDDVRALITAANARGPKGQLDGPDNAYMIADNDQLFTADAYRPLILRSKNGAIVRLSAVASVIDSVVDTRQAAWFNDERAVLVIIFKQPNANVIETVDSIKAMEPQLEKWMPAGVKTSILSDRTATIRSSVRDVQYTLLLTVVLVVAIVFVFLRRFWSTFAAAVTVPLSLAGTCAGMYACGYSVDNLSLMALAIAVGFVVDDAIVMIENITRRAEAGDRPMQAALTGARQIGFTVVSISISLIAVFIPLLFMSGIIGRLFREFAVTMSMAIAISAVVSLTATPMICGHLARALKAGESERRGWLDRISEGSFDLLRRLYASCLDVVLKKKVLTFAVTLATVAFTVYLYMIAPQGFFPQQDTGRMTAKTEAPADTSFQTMLERQRKITDVLLANPDVAAFSSSIGGSGFNPFVNQGRFFIDLKPIGVRTKPISDVMNDLRRETAKVRGITFFPQPMQDVRVGGIASKSQYQYTLSDLDVAELNAFSPRLLRAMRALPQLVSVTTDQTLGGLEARLVIDRDAASRMGISPSDVDAALYTAFGQRQTTVIYTEIDQYRVVIEADPVLQQDPSSLDRIFVKSRSGQQVPLGSLARLERGTLPLAINHQGQFPAVTLSFDLAPNVSLSQATEAIEARMRELQPPPGLRASFMGTAQAFQQSRASQVWLILSSIIAIYIILGVLYESLIHPITILSTIPSAGVGALLALKFCGYPLDVMGLIGIILLIGIVKKNAIMMIDFAMSAERERGLSPETAIREACLLRFRPIMMTTLAALLGALPLALGHGSGSEMRRPLGIAIVGGLIASQALTLFTTPVVYIVLDRFSKLTRLVKTAQKMPAQAAGD